MAIRWRTDMRSNGNQLDHQIISQIIEPGSRVLDLGCGNGDLLYLLVKEKGARVQGIEANDVAISDCVKKGLSVYHGDLESGLTEYPDQSFDYVILNQSMQEVKRVDWLIQEALRAGNRVIVGFPNFAYLQARIMLFLKGKAPITRSLPYRWDNTPNVRFLSIADFRDFCRGKDLIIQQEYFLGGNRQIHLWPNLFGLNAIFVVSKNRRKSKE